MSTAENTTSTNSSAGIIDDEQTYRTSFDVVLTILLLFIALLGVLGNMLTLLSLFITQKLRRLLKHTTVLVDVLALSDLILCGVGVPLYTANLIIGYGAPFSTSPVVCHLVEYLCWGGSNVSIWLLFFIAFMRLISTLYPIWHRTHLANRCIVWTLVVVCYLIAYVPYALGPLGHLYYVKPEHPGTGMCYPNTYWPGDPYSEEIFRAYEIIDAVLHCWVPLFGGLVCYMIIYVRIGRSQKTAQIPVVGVNYNTTVAAERREQSLTIAVAAPYNMHKTVPSKHSDKIKVLVLNFLCNIVLTSPAMFIWGMGYAGAVAMASLFFSKATTVLYFCSFPINPIIYVTLSQDFRRGFADTLRKVFCRKISSLPTATVADGSLHNQKINKFKILFTLTA